MHIKSSLTNIFIYFMFLLTIPISVAKDWKPYTVGFFGVTSRRKYHLVDCGVMKMPVPRGSLGLRSLIEFNKALQGSS